MVPGVDALASLGPSCRLISSPRTHWSVNTGSRKPHSNLAGGQAREGTQAQEAGGTGLERWERFPSISIGGKNWGGVGRTGVGYRDRDSRLLKDRALEIQLEVTPSPLVAQKNSS